MAVTDGRWKRGEGEELPLGTGRGPVAAQCVRHFFSFSFSCLCFSWLSCFLATLLCFEEKGLEARDSENSHDTTITTAFNTSQFYDPDHAVLSRAEVLCRQPWEFAHVAGRGEGARPPHELLPAPDQHCRVEGIFDPGWPNPTGGMHLYGSYSCSCCVRVFPRAGPEKLLLGTRGDLGPWWYGDSSTHSSRPGSLHGDFSIAGDERARH